MFSDRKTMKNSLIFIKITFDEETEKLDFLDTRVVLKMPETVAEYS